MTNELLLLLLVGMPVLTLLTVLFIGVRLMATASEIKADLDIQAQAIVNLVNRLGTQSGITLEQSEELRAKVQANTAAIDAILPSP